MKYFSSATLILLVLLMLCSGAAASAKADTKIRAVWVSAWSSGFFTPRQVDETLKAAKQAGISDLFIQVRKNADAYYSSDIEKPGAGLQKGFDPLEYTLPRAHKMGIKVHAWVNAYRVWTAPDLPEGTDHVVSAHPEWLNLDCNGEMRSSDGIYLDPGSKEAAAYVLSVVTDIARRYDVDGIHLDYIRYPGNKWGYSDAALQAFAQASGRTDRPVPTDAEFSEWRRAQVTALIRNIFIQVRKVRPNAVVSASAICWGDAKGAFEETSAYRSTLQDWRKWTSAGYLDAILPMNYVEHAKGAERYNGWLAAFKRWKLEKPVYVGLYATVNTAENTKKQAELAESAGFEGWSLFSFNRGELRNKLVKAFGSAAELR